MLFKRNNPAGSAEQFFGPRKKYGPKICSLPKSHFDDATKSGTILVGDLVRNAPEGAMMVEVPSQGCKKCGIASDEYCYEHVKDIDIFRQKLIKSKKKPIVISNASGTMVMVVSGDKVVGSYPATTTKAEAIQKRRRNAVNDLDKSLSKAEKLHLDFHGVPYDQADKLPIKKIDIKPPDKLFFVGWLNHIIYDVPDYSARRGVPFIHEGQDRGDDKPKAREKPFVCVSEHKDYCVIYGSQFEFGPRGMIG